MANSKSNTHSVFRFVNHSRRAVRIAIKHGWLPGARYTNLRDVRTFDRLGFLDIHWTQYNFAAHLTATRQTRPIVTVDRDIENYRQLPQVLDEAAELAEFADYVIVVPKDKRGFGDWLRRIPSQFLLGFSVPSRYGSTAICPSLFRRPVHLLGGRPDVQRELAKQMPVFSFDNNRFTFDAAFGDYFDGETFRPHPTGGYERCLEDSVRNINALWQDYHYSESSSVVTAD